MYPQPKGENGWTKTTAFTDKLWIPSSSNQNHSKLKNTGDYNHHFSVVLFMSVLIYTFDNHHFFVIMKR